MGLAKGVAFKTPDGVERELRYTLGAARRIKEKFGSTDIRQILNDHEFMALPDLLYACLFDKDGNPPDISVEFLTENLGGDVGSNADTLSLFLSAMSQGAVEKNVLSPMLMRAWNESMKSQTSDGSGATAEESSASETPNSGASRRGSLRSSASGRRKSRTDGTSEPV